MAVAARKLFCRRATAKTRRWVRNRFRKWCVNEELVVPTRAGFRMAANPRDYASYGIYFFGEYDAPMSSVLRHLVREGETAWDVGTERGWFSCLLAHLVGPTGRVDSFEAFPTNAARLRGNLALNNMDWVRVNEVAVSDAPGEASFQLPTPEVIAGFSHLEHCSGVGYLTDETTADTIRVPTLSLDDYAERNNLRSLALIKMDIEGAEVRALQGAARVLRTLRPIVAIEYNRAALALAGTSWQALDALLEAADYNRYTFRDRFVQLRLSDWDDATEDEAVFNVYAFPKRAGHATLPFE
jgi:FkbM family methyltransferase